MIWKKSAICITIFSIMFIGAWYENNSHKRVYQTQNENVEEIILQKATLSTSNPVQTKIQFENPILTPFKSREYIRIVNQTTTF
ncbi:hypothetical protein [Bacillus sp. Marseille-P3661]|uniref:hypothetical protein n=1 Tax=Bacillus sp. Marseille-P3661 TaxID=1936234 RepID=UPI000C82C498|nr:hypothetical protein [Bacillus sp. Marseille-P3661]